MGQYKGGKTSASKISYIVKIYSSPRLLTKKTDRNLNSKSKSHLSKQEGREKKIENHQELFNGFSNKAERYISRRSGPRSSFFPTTHFNFLNPMLSMSGL